MIYMKQHFLMFILFIFFVAGGVGSPMISSAQGAQGSETTFGGMHLIAIQCTCGSDSLHYIQDYKSNRLWALLSSPGRGRLFSNNNLYGTYQLGTYESGGQSCKIEAGEDCVDINSDGNYPGSQPGVGTSFLRSMNTFVSIFSPLLKVTGFGGSPPNACSTAPTRAFL